MSQSILFLAHVSEAGNTLPKSSYEVLGAALELTKQLGARLTIGLIGEDVSAAAQTVASAGAERILAVAGPDFSTARYASDAAAAEAICRSAAADLILAPATSRFMRVLAGVAHRLNGCVDTHARSRRRRRAGHALALSPADRSSHPPRRATLVGIARVRLSRGLGYQRNDRNTRRGPGRTDSGDPAESGRKNGRQRHPRSEERRTNHPARRQLAVCCGRRLDQEAGRRQNPRRAGRVCPRAATARSPTSWAGASSTNAAP